MGNKPTKTSFALTRRGLLASLPLWALGSPAVGAETRPNIVFIMADDMGFADASCYGNPLIHTPNIDALAASGIQFGHAYANSAVCSATRTALMTGRYQDRLACGLEEPIADYAIGFL